MQSLQGRRSGSTSANDLVKNFLGRPQNTAAIQKWAGKEFEVAP
jgi:hypothetical protein